MLLGQHGNLLRFMASLVINESLIEKGAYSLRKRGTLMGSLNKKQQRQTIEDQVKGAKNRGAKVLTRGQRPAGKEFEKGYF
jgi:acyl-CoA reductase-like NAD-dependent aldehyde dehydrogenase